MQGSGHYQETKQDGARYSASSERCAVNHTLQKDSRGALVTSFLQIFLLFYFHVQVVRLPLNLNETSRKKQQQQQQQQKTVHTPTEH